MMRLAAGKSGALWHNRRAGQTDIGFFCRPYLAYTVCVHTIRVKPDPRHERQTDHMPMSLSLIIPSFNAASRIAATVRAWRATVMPDQVIVSDGGSTDGTREMARTAGAETLIGPTGRGRQLALGAGRAKGDWLLFMHADTMPGTHTGRAARAFMGEAANRQRVAAFRLTLDSEAAPARRVERLANWRARRFGLPYGDQGLLIARDYYQGIGGFHPLPLMEDVEFVRRVGRDRVSILNGTVMTSAERYRRDGYWKRPARNMTILGLYFLGVPPHRLARLYGLHG